MKEREIECRMIDTNSYGAFVDRGGRGGVGDVVLAFGRCRRLGTVDVAARESSDRMSTTIRRRSSS